MWIDSQWFQQLQSRGRSSEKHRRVTRYLEERIKFKKSFVYLITCTCLPSRTSVWWWHVVVPLATSSQSGVLGQFHSRHATVQYAAHNASLISPGAEIIFMVFFLILLICSNSCIRTKSNVKAKEKWTCSAHVALKSVTTWWRNLILLTFSIFNIPYRYSTALYQPVKYSWRWFSLFCFHFFSSDSKCSSLCSSVRWNRVWD